MGYLVGSAHRRRASGWWLTIPEQLNAFEQTNILAATEWALRPARRPQPARVLTTDYLLGLHRRMFGQTWRWAGELRRTNKHIGVHWPTIRVALRERLDDAQLWIAHDVYAPDTLLHSQRIDTFSWGAADLSGAGASRAAYLEALRAADRGDFAALMAFVRS
jgi:fido (protein-threonine AMPylation protein)